MIGWRDSSLAQHLASRDASSAFWCRIKQTLFGKKKHAWKTLEQSFVLLPPAFSEVLTVSILWQKQLSLRYTVCICSNGWFMVHLIVILQHGFVQQRLNCWPFMLHKKKRMLWLSVGRMSSGVSQSEERSCSIVWWYDSGHFCFFCQMATDCSCGGFPQISLVLR